MEVRLYPNLRRPGVGSRPHRESQRPLLPQHARHCPVLEAGSALGFLVHAPLKEDEAFQIGYDGEGRYRFVYQANISGAWQPIFSVLYVLPIGGIGASKEEVTLHIPAAAESRQGAAVMARALIVPGDLGTPPGAVSLRGAWNFLTPPGWDTVYTSVFNMIERPMAPMLSIRVETDWYAHGTAFRYVLQPGETISASHSVPIGQVFFVPRDEILLRDCTEDELAAIDRSMDEFAREKSALTLKTSYGMPYSPHYLRKSRSATAALPDAPDTTAAADAPYASRPGAPPPDEPPQSLGVQRLVPTAASIGRGARVPEIGPAVGAVGPGVGRNDPCPCGSGQKYKRCHGKTG